jgi:hypothetical protein
MVSLSIFAYYFVWWVRLSPLGTSATNWPIVSLPASHDRCVWSIWWIEKWQGRPKYSEETCSQQIPQDLTLDRTRAAAVGSWGLIA